ncbi:MAG: 2-oxoacid:acceptor oxidoreductase subunit alpha [Rubrivivax sp.]|nr:2-oxoacid:acceptor oxidoreductase subunit alpha [Rubrivivax sp.]
MAIAGSGGAGVMTAGTLLLDAAARAGLYGLMVRTSGPQIRGGEAAALLRLGPQPVVTLDDGFDLLLAIDWQNLHRFADEIPLSQGSLLVGDVDAGEAPAALLRSGARLHALALKKAAKAAGGAWVNMIALGLAGTLAGVPAAALEAALRASWKRGEESLAPNLAALLQGVEMANGLPGERPPPLLPRADAPAGRWMLSGNEAAGCGALRGGVRFVAAYPITPATELLEWMAPALARVGGTLLQAEDELASVNMIIGASYGGVPSLTATAGPGLALMTEGIGLAVTAEVPIVVVDVMRGGPSTGIPAKSEQSDLSFAVDGLHGDAPRLVLAPNSIADCLTATEWAVQLAEALQAPAIVLSDQFMGQSRAVIDRPPAAAEAAHRLTAPARSAPDAPAYQRYLDTPSGVSPMAVPGTPGNVYTADGLEHTERGIPSSQASDHRKQLDKRLRKLEQHDYGPRWADVEGDADLAIITFGSTTGAVREAVARAAVQGVALRLLSLRLLAPLRTDALDQALQGVRQVLVVEQNHGGQLLRYLRSRFDLPGRASGLHRPGPLPLRPGELCTAFVDWAAAHAPQEITA